MSPGALVVTGLNKEAQIASGPGILAVAGGADRAGLERQLEAVDPSSIRFVLSFGIAGALDPGLRVGDVVIATEIGSSGACWPTSQKVRAQLTDGLRDADVAVVECPVLGVDAPLLTPSAKQAAFAHHRADAVDMESHVAAAFAARLGLPFGTIRVISDKADHVLPPAAGAAMRPDGSVDVLGVVRSLARDPRQIPALVATARDAAVAFRVLGRVRGLLGLSGGLLSLDL